MALKDITLGQYFPGKSLIHRFDPRSKIIFTVLFIVAIFLCKTLLSYVLPVVILLAFIAISRVQPKVLILDEPTAGLDPAGSASILANIDDYRRANNATVIIVSHSMEDVARLTDRLAVVSHGKLPYVGSPREVFSHGAELEELGLAVPAMNRVFSRVRGLGVDIDPAVYTVEQAKAAFLEAYRGRGRA